MEVLSSPLATVLAGSVYILVVSVHQPAAMFLMDPRGLWLQVLCVWLSGLVGMVLAISLIPELGAAALYSGTIRRNGCTPGYSVYLYFGSANFKHGEGGGGRRDRVNSCPKIVKSHIHEGEK